MAILEVAPYGCSEAFCKVSVTSDVDGYVVLLWGAGEGERVILPDGNLRTAKEDILHG